ncbi:MAG: ORF6N domain-containing protein [Elusimicrobiota bacterium]
MQLFEGVNRLVSMEITKIGMLIYVVRGQRVMMDRDLAALYGVRTRILNRAVRRQAGRFPSDFMFQLTAAETKNWKSQIGTSNPAVMMGLRKRPLAFTEHGVAMLSGVLNSERAIRVNIEIMRAFVNQRRLLGTSKKLTERMEKAEKKLSEHEGHIGTLFEEIEALSNPSTGPKRNIGFSGE